VFPGEIGRFPGGGCQAEKVKESMGTAKGFIPEWEFCGHIPIIKGAMTVPVSGKKNNPCFDI